MRNFDCSMLEVLGPALEGDVEDGRTELLDPLLLPRVDGRPAVERAGRHVVAVLVEPAVAAHAVGDQRFGDHVVGEQLGLGEGDLSRGHDVSPWGRAGPPAWW